MTHDNYIKLLNKYKKIIEDNNLGQLFGLSNSLIENMADNCILGKQYKIMYRHSTLYYILMFIAAILANYLYGLFIKRPSIDFHDRHCVFVKLPSKFNRFGKLSQRIEGCIVCTVPIFELNGLKRIYNIQKDNTNLSTVLFLSFMDVIDILIFILKHMRTFIRIGRCNDYIEGDYNLGKYLLVFTLKCIVCEKSIIPITNLIDDNTTFITDNDKTPIVFCLKSIREKQNKVYKILTINHGAFVGFDLTYNKPYSDLVLCTCNREIYITKRYSENCNIDCYGVQLSTFIDDNITTDISENKCDLLILGTVTNNNWGPLQMKILQYLKENNVNFKYRLRPASAKKDEEYLSKVLIKEDFNHGTSLLEDCVSCRRIISFSLDALGRAVIMKKPVAIYVDDQTFFDFSPIGEQSRQVFVTNKYNDIIEFIENAQVEKEYSSNTKQWIYDNIGELRFDKIVDNIIRYI